MNVTLAVVGKDFSEPDESIAASHIAQVQPLHAVVKSRMIELSAVISILSLLNMTKKLSSPHSGH